MSRSNPTPTNPATRYFKWKGSTGELTYWDKTEEKEYVIKLPFEFLVLDELSTIAGYCEPDNSSYWANEVRSLASQELNVRTSSGSKEVGLYKDLQVRSKGAKFASSIYITYKENDEWVIGNLKATGAAVGAWFDFKKGHNPQNGKVVLTGSTEAKKGATKYFVPTFEYQSASSDENEIAVDLDKELQVYLSQYLAPRIVDDAPPVSDEDYPGDITEEDLPLSFRE